MIQYLVKRVLWAAVLFLAITLVTYIIFFVIPTGFQYRIAGRARETIDVRRATGINGPFYSEYAQFLKHLARGSLGTSFSGRRDVREVIENAAPVTGSLVFGGALLWLAIALPIGVLSALRPRSLLDRAAVVFVLIGISAHPVWIGLVLAHLFGYRWHVTPLSGYCDFFSPSLGSGCGGPAQWAYHLILPWITFAILFSALYVRMVRATVMEVMNEDYVRTARAKGASEWRVLRGHVLRNAMLPILTMLGMDVGLAMGGSVFVETVYGLPGLGKTVIAAYSRRDLPVIMGVVVVVTTAVIVFNLLVDIAYAALDPRIKLAERGVGRRVRRRRAGRGTAAVSEPVAP